MNSCFFFYSPLLEEQCCESCGLHQCKTHTHMSEHLYRTAPEVSRVSDIYSSSYSSQAPSVCVSLNRFCDETLSEFHSKRPDTAGRISGLSFSFHHRHHRELQFYGDWAFSLEKLHNLSECCVDLEVGSFTECFLHNGHLHSWLLSQHWFRQLLQKLCPHGVLTGSVNTSRHTEHWSPSARRPLKDDISENKRNYENVSPAVHVYTS